MVSIFAKRVIAYILDFFVVSSLMWIISYLLFILVNPYDTYKIYHYFAYVIPFLIMIYFVLCEKLAGASIGKSLMYLKVTSKNGAKISWIQAIIRNLTKIYWIPIIFDWLIGKLLHSDRFLNNITRTVVVDDVD